MIYSMKVKLRNLQKSLYNRTASPLTVYIIYNSHPHERLRVETS